MNVSFVVNLDPVTNGTTSDRIYQKIVQHLASQIPNAVLIERDPAISCLEKLIGENPDVIVTTSGVITDCTECFRKLSVVVVVIGEASRNLQGLVDVLINPLGLDKREHFCGPEYLPKTVLDKFGVNKVAECIGMPPTDLQDIVDCNVASYALKEVVLLCRKLDWDTNFFGFPVAFVTTRRLTPAIEAYIRRYALESNIRFLEYLCNCHDPLSVRTAEENGYKFVDIRVTLEKNLTDPGPTSTSIDSSVGRKGINTRRANESDIDALIALTNELYLDSRFFFDGNFSKDLLNNFYSDWLAKAVRGEFDDFALIIVDPDNEEIPVGFCTIRKKPTAESVAVIGLFGISTKYQKRGFAQRLLLGVFSELQSHGFKKLEVVTQGRNYDAQRVYQREGFVTKIMELWYHKWFH